MDEMQISAPKQANTKNNRKSKLSPELRFALISEDPFPPHMVKQFRYAETFQFTTGAAGVVGTEQVMRLNSMFDPNQTGVGHQPYGYDQYMGTIYQKYRVLRASFEITFTTPGAANDVFCCALLSGAGNILSLTGMSIDRAGEIPRVLHKQLSSAGSRKAVISSRSMIPLELLFGITRGVLANSDDYAAVNTASPANVATLAFSVGSYSGQGAEAVSAQVVIVYEAIIYDRIGVTQS
jgi:hypothetical protein